MAQGELVVFCIVDGGEVEIQEAVLWVEDLDIAGDCLFGFREGDCIDSADFRRELFPQCIGGIEPEKAA